jgi:hypothetical protein
MASTKFLCGRFAPLPATHSELWYPRCTKPGQGARMSQPSGHQVCSHRCDLPVPVELDPVGLCVYHFTSSVEHTCSEMHRQIALRGATAERQAEVGTYIGECSLLLARVGGNLRLSYELKRRLLCTFLSLMNLRENLERAASSRVPERPIQGSSSASGGPLVPDRVHSALNAGLHS